ncbi:MAG: hypothetical protein F6K00_01450 [Leptolyngbya sp. SIOISBB]|nr:hypothetical protein [Leptolyngbya sp. SIOISBB]
MPISLPLAALDYSTTLKTAFYAMLALGFLAAVVIGSIAWYNSKKPPGWEGAEKPGWVPGVDAEEPSSDDAE